MSEPVRAYVALGSNLGDRAAHLIEARRLLVESEAIVLVAASRIWETDPVGPAGQGAYLNAVISVDTRLSPRPLLDRLLDVERRAGRDRESESVRWGPRVIDLDLLLYAEQRVAEPGLEVPHPRLHERAFVLEPLCEIAASLRHPQLGDPMALLLARCRKFGSVRALEPTAAWPVGADDGPSGL